MDMELEQLNYAGLTCEVSDVPEMVFKARVAQALQQGISRYPIYRQVHFAARVELEALLDAIAMDLSWHAERIESTYMVLDGEGMYATGWGRRKAEYCSVSFGVWARDPQRAEEVRARILAKAAATRITQPMFTINWHFRTGQGGVDSASIEEIADDALLDEAYPEIVGGVRSFIESYLDAKETVLVLQGPPGTGKTRLIRAVLGEISRRNDGEAQALYTGDMKALENDQIFVKFITGWDDAFVVEDADHLLKPRADGNEHLHRFLTIADGVVRSQGRKIIFSTNLPNIGDLDEALIRPGRCFARVLVRNLTSAEAQALAAELAGEDASKLARASAALAGDSGKRSLAEVYAALR
jgi:hypothetical protein